MAQEDENEIDQLAGMSMEELISVEVISASNRSEKLNEAPATIVVITAQDIKERGYFELFDVLNDLPGLDLSRAFGDDYFYVYARGYRKTTSDQMLLMINGMIMNNLFNNNMNAYAQYPINNIKQIEIVYGPASAVYGANAFAGVINIITEKEEPGKLSVSAGSNGTNLIDAYFSENKGDLSISLSGRMYHSDGPDLEGRQPFISNNYLNADSLWGAFNLTDYKGYKSPINGDYLHGIIRYNGIEAGVINWTYESGLGSEFAGDRALNSLTWQTKELTLYGKYETSIGDLSSKSIIRYRRSDIPGSSGFIQRYTFVDSLRGNPAFDYKMSFESGEYWQATNRSVQFQQDFIYHSRSNFTVNFGLKFDRRFLNRDYVIDAVGVTRPVDSVYLSPFPFPEPIQNATIDQHNHSTLIDRGMYGQINYSLFDNADIILGIRYDNNNIWKSVFSPRTGIVYQLKEEITVKVFYGTAFLEPSARILYGGWTGSLSNPDLQPEKMRTFEISTNYRIQNFSTGLNFFVNNAPGAISTVNSVPINLGNRRMIGFEYNARALLNNKASFITKVKGDVYVSYIKSEDDLIKNGDFQDTGNMAALKVKGIFTTYFKSKLSLSFQARYIGDINTTITNPIRKIPSYFVSDIYLGYNNLLIQELSIGLKIYNAFDVDYWHPGYRAASAGENTQIGSQGFYNSRLPQPERHFLITMGFDF